MSFLYTKKKIASEKISLSKLKDCLFFGICGLNSSINNYKFHNKICIEKINEQPCYIELIQCLKNKGYADTISKYAPYITHQLIIEYINDINTTLNIAYFIVSLIRIKTCSIFFVPAALSQSWELIPGCDKDSVSAIIIEDTPNILQKNNCKEVTNQDLDWVSDSLDTFLNLYSNNDKFKISVEALTDSQNQSDRMSIACLWTGIESIFGISSELSYRLSLYITVLAEKNRSNRKKFFKNIKNMYKFRSKVVHGIYIEKKDILHNVQMTRELLSLLVCNIIDNKKMPTIDDLEDNLFS